ncbi:MAG: thiolase family protein [Conexivisphaerales archaeon]
MNDHKLHEAVILSAVRTPVGKYAGKLSSVRADDLAALIITEAVKRAGIEPADVDDVILGCSNQAGEDNRNIARMAVLLAGFPDSVPGVTVNRLCGSGLEAVNMAARSIMLGDAEVIVAGGVESMSRAPLVTLKPEKGFPRGGMKLVDTTIGWRFVNPRWPSKYPTYEMGETAENLAEKYGISRERQDEFAFRSHERAIRANDSGNFKDEIIPVHTGSEVVAVDEGPRRNTSLEKLSSLPPVFRKGGTVTAGNSSQISDGASALLVASRDFADSHNLKPIARYVASSNAGVDPSYMGIGPIPATKKLLQKTGLTVKDFGVVELNEAFAAQVLACLVEMPELQETRLNPNGGAIALGHPIGCSGARIATTLVHEMKRINAKYGLATMCIGVGQGISTAFELEK